MIKRENVTGLILAGGAGRRVGGEDKGLLSWQNRALVAHVAQRLRPQVGQLLISCNRNFEHYAALAEITVADTRGGFQGPLAGLEAAIDYINTDVVVLAACDTPLIPLDMARRLLEALDAGQVECTDISYAHDGSRAQYLCAALRTRCLPSLHQYLDDGHRSVHQWYQHHRCRAVDFSDQADCFSNYNRLD